ncbi:hypothetical protein GQ44DRAFT_645964 [Phaeosphaeriaceae sp. PMI808]|nr:hypothetical protein GQ44DRAFT_645964 [Phaeosphaeriaceae sp. PMI808]
MTVRSWYKALTPRTRLFIGVGVMAYGGLGLFLSDRAEQHFDLVPTDQDKEALQKDIRNALPRITTVEKGNR